MEVVCDICGENFKNNQGLGGHKRLKHSIPGEQQYVPSARVLDAIQDLEKKLMDTGSSSVLWDRVALLGERIKQLEHDVEEQKREHQEDMEGLKQANERLQSTVMRSLFGTVEKAEDRARERMDRLKDYIQKRLDELQDRLVKLE